jgi:hypothetical protein
VRRSSRIRVDAIRSVRKFIVHSIEHRRADECVICNIFGQNATLARRLLTKSIRRFPRFIAARMTLQFFSSRDPAHMT